MTRLTAGAFVSGVFRIMKQPEDQRGQSAIIIDITCNKASYQECCTIWVTQKLKKSDKSNVADVPPK